MLGGHVLDFSANIEVFEDLQNFNFEKIIGEIHLCLWEILNVIVLADCVIGEKILTY